MNMPGMANLSAMGITPERRRSRRNGPMCSRVRDPAYQIRCMVTLTRDEVAVVAVHIVVGHAIVDGGGTAPSRAGGTCRDRRDARRKLPPPPYKSFNLAAARSTVQEWRVHHARLAVPDGGEPVETTGSGSTIRARRVESRAGGEEESVLCGRDDLGTTDISCVGDLSQLLLCPPALEASACAAIRCATLLAALSSAHSWASVRLEIEGQVKGERLAVRVDAGVKGTGGGELGEVDLSSRDLDIILASLASI
ncbi:hypothetical protein BJY52DRAFT_1227314 [Lactarius psammicola]|nr:hypothetical protein BJY52DRAFT_1227314 [Lactarius psammicola]